MTTHMNMDNNPNPASKSDQTQEVLQPKKRTLVLRVRSPERIIYQGEVNAISCKNDQGPFDVLEAHGNFISIIKEKITIYEKNGKHKDIPIDKGVLKVYGDQVNIFLGLENLKE